MFKAPGLTTFSIGPIEIQIWGTLVALGFLAGYFLAQKRARRMGFAKTDLQNLFIIILASSIVGARLFYVLLFPAQFKNLVDLFQINEGGMAFFGGFILAILSSVIYCRIKKISFWKFADVVTPALALGYGIGRIGCFLTDFHPGIPTNLPWGFEYEGVVRHPTALYSSLAGFLIFGILLWVEKVKSDSKSKTTPTWGEGKIGILFIILFSTYRFLLDFIRAYDLSLDPRFWGLTYAQITALVLLVGSLVLIIRKRTLEKRLQVVQ